MNPGKLDRPLVLLRRTVATDGAGAPVETWADCAILWGERIQPTATETTSNGTTRSAVSAAYRVRYRTDLVAADAPGIYRVRADGRTFDLVSALEDDKQPRRSALLLSLAYVQGEPTLAIVPSA